MDNCMANIFTLPTLNFVGGETQDLSFSIYYYKHGKPYSLSACEANLSIVSMINKNGQPILSKQMSVRYDSTGTVDNVLYVTLMPEDTINLSGKYLYEIQIRDIDGDVEIPKQGFMYIVNNINKNFILN